MSKTPKLTPEEQAEAAILHERLSEDGDELERFIYSAVFIRARLERDLAAERERADMAKAEGIKEGMRRAAELVGHYTSEDGEIAAETILKEAGE